MGLRLALPIAVTIMTKWGFLFLLTANTIFAQDVVINNSTIQISDKFELVSPSIDQQYVATQWAKAKLFYANGTSKNYDSLNFNRYANEIEIVVNNKVITLRPIGISAALIYHTSTSGSLLMVGSVNDQSLFLLVQSEGKFVLASYLATNEIKKEENYKVDEVRFVPRKKDVIIIKENYVVRKEDVWSEFKLNKSSVSKLFKIEKKTFQDIVAAQGINVGGKEELVQIFNILNGN